MPPAPHPTRRARRQPPPGAIRPSTRCRRLRPCRWTTPPRTRSFTAPGTADFLALLTRNASLSLASGPAGKPATVCLANFDSLNVLAVSFLFFLSAEGYGIRDNHVRELARLVRNMSVRNISENQ